MSSAAPGPLVLPPQQPLGAAGVRGAASTEAGRSSGVAVAATRRASRDRPLRDGNLSRVVVGSAVDRAEEQQEADDQSRAEQRDLEADRDPDEDEHDDPDAVLLDGGTVVADRVLDRRAIRRASGGARRAAARRGTGRRTGSPGGVARVGGRRHDPLRATPQVGGDDEHDGPDEDEDRDAAQVLQRRVDHRPGGSRDIAFRDPTDDDVLGRADGQACQQERDEHAEAEIDEHPAPVGGQPERKRDQDHAEDDQQDHDHVERTNDRPCRRQSLGRHQPDRPEVGWKRHTERSLEALGQHVRGIGRAQVGELDIGRDQSHRLQLGQGGAHDREDIERHVAIGDDPGLRFRRAGAARSGRG